MLPASAWDDSQRDTTRSGAWSVMGHLRRHQRRRSLYNKRWHLAQRTGGQDSYDMVVAPDRQAYESAFQGRPRGGPCVMAFLFAQPTSDAIRTLDEAGDYLDIRTGDTWDLFFPGYYKSDDPQLERALGSSPVGQGFASYWYFSATAFNQLRAHVEAESEHRWSYSGGTDLVLINAWLPENGEPTIDWASTQSGPLTDAREGTTTLTLGQIIERMTSDLELDSQDRVYGLEDVLDPPPLSVEERAWKKVLIGALGGMLAAIGKSRLGL